MQWLEHRIPPPIVGTIAGVAMCLVAPLGPAWVSSGSAALAAAAALAAVGLAFELGGVLAFRAARTTVNPLSPQKASQLVTRGVYRITRNPMYVGMCCILLGWAVHLRAGLPFLGPLVFALYITRFQILPEERALRQLFGQAYVEYAHRVRRWL